MNFEIEYTTDQEQFRQEVRAFLESNLPDGLVATIAQDGVTYEQYQKQRELARSLGERGWLYPTYPQEYGGGGLDIDHAIILEEELDRLGLHNPPYYDSGGRMGAPTILVWGSEEQKQRYLPPIFRGEVRTWQLLTEPSAGSDLASVTTKAIRDGDDYVINGQKTFVGSNHGADKLWMIAVTDPNAPRHQNVSWFMVDSDLPGISYSPLNLLAVSSGEAGSPSGEKQTVYFDDVRVPDYCLVGGENNGWKVASTHLEIEHGGGGNIGKSILLERLLNYCRTHNLDDQPLVQHQDIRDLLTDVYMDLHLTHLYGLRNYYLAHAGKERSYEGPQFSMHRKVSSLHMTGQIQKILHYYALTTDPAYDVEEGHIELQQRQGIVGTHPGGTIEVQKLIMARRIGIGRTAKEQAGTLA